MFSDIIDVMFVCVRENFKKGDKFCYLKSVIFDSCFVIKIYFVKYERYEYVWEVVYVFIIIRKKLLFI